MGEKLIVPILRFKEFSAEWEEKELNKITKIYDGTHSTPKYVEKGIPFYSVEHITANQFKHTKYISEEVFKKENQRVKLERNDILMTRIGDIGTSRLLDWDVKASFYVTLALIKHNKEFNSSFLNQSIKSNNIQKQLHSKTLHVAFPKKINLGEIGQCKVFLPSKDEQEKIASFLSSIDKKIEQLSKKDELLHSYKKGVIQKIFSQEIRFSPKGTSSQAQGEKDGSVYPDWEEKKLGDIIDVIDGDRGINYPNGVDFTKNGFCLFLNAKNVTKKGFKFEEKQFITEDKDNLLSKGKLKRFDIVLTTRGTVGQFAFYDDNIQFNNIRINSGMVILRNKNEQIFTNYLYKIFNSYFFKKQIDKVAFGSAQPQLTVKEIKKFRILIPQLEEQTKIANFLSSIDTKISQNKKALEETKKFKKALLQQMFI